MDHTAGFAGRPIKARQAAKPGSRCARGIHGGAMTRTTTLLFLLLIAAAIWLSWRHWQNAKALLQDWAAANGLRILHAKSNAFWLAMPLSMWFHLEVPDGLPHLGLRRSHPPHPQRPGAAGHAHLGLHESRRGRGVLGRPLMPCAAQH